MEAEEYAQRLIDRIYKRSFYKLRLVLRCPDMYHLTQEQADKIARGIVKKKGLTKADCKRLGLEYLAEFCD